MFEQLTDKLGQTLRNIVGTGQLNEKNIGQALEEVRETLLNADAALVAIDALIDKVKADALGQSVPKGLTPGQFFIKLVKEALTELMGAEHSGLALNTQPPAVILMAGLQGAGKTSMSAKLGLRLKTQDKKSVMVVSTDVYRPAAQTQLETYASEADLRYFASSSDKPAQIAKEALSAAKKQAIDVLIIDTAGRLHVDGEMMQEIKELHKISRPIETLFVVDSMTGQDAANTAKAFHDALPLTGLVLTKIDGDARGGAALSIRHITGQPIKFMGVGEKLEDLELFYPDRIASRILGMGDVLSLIEEIEQKVDKKQAEKLAKKIKKGRGFDLEDLKNQLLQMDKMGGMGSIMGKLPGMGQLANQVKDKMDDGQMFKKMISIILSMTPDERAHPLLVKNKGSRKRRIAQGAGANISEVNQVLKQHEKMSKNDEKSRCARQ